MLGALLMLGLQPGPLLFQQQPQFVWGLIASMYIGNVMLLVLNLPLVGMWVKLLDVPLYLLLNFIILFSFLGVYTMNNSVQDLVLMVGFGVIGYLMKRLDIPASPIILGMVLGKLMEEKMRQSLGHLRWEPHDLRHPPDLRHSAAPGADLDHQPVLETDRRRRPQAVGHATSHLRETRFARYRTTRWSSAAPSGRVFLAALAARLLGGIRRPKERNVSRRQGG